MRRGGRARRLELVLDEPGFDRRPKFDEERLDLGDVILEGFGESGGGWDWTW